MRWVIWSMPQVTITQEMGLRGTKMSSLPFFSWEVYKPVAGRERMISITGMERSTVGSWERERIYKMHRGYRTSLLAQLVKNLPAMQETPVRFLGQEVPLEKGRLPTPVLLGFPDGSDSKISTCNAGDPGLGRSSGGGHGNHSSILAWRILWTGEPGSLQSMESQRVRHDWATKQSIQHRGFKWQQLLINELLNMKETNLGWFPGFWFVNWIYIDIH